MLITSKVYLKMKNKIKAADAMANAICEYMKEENPDAFLLGMSVGMYKASGEVKAEEIIEPKLGVTPSRKYLESLIEKEHQLALGCATEDRRRWHLEREKAYNNLCCVLYDLPMSCSVLYDPPM